MIGYWVSFALLFPVILIGATAFKIWAKKKCQMKITPAMDRAANRKIFRYVLFYWLCDLFYMACFTNNIVCKYVFGGLILSIIFMNLVNLFTFPKEKSRFEKWGLLQDFLVGIGLSVYLIFIIPNAEVKAIVIPIVAATFGGLLTLVGVAWTIREGQKERAEDRKQLEEDRKEEGRKKYLPIVNSCIDYITPDHKVTVLPTNNTNYIAQPYFKIENFEIKNTDFSSFYLRNFIIDNEFLTINPLFFIDKKHIIEFDTSKVYLKNIPSKIAITIRDMIGNNYIVRLDFEISSESAIKIIGCYDAELNKKEAL